LKTLKKVRIGLRLKGLKIVRIVVKVGKGTTHSDILTPYCSRILERSWRIGKKPAPSNIG